MELVFNTGRPYAKEGQRVVARKVEGDGNVWVFVDLTRYVEGVVIPAPFETMTESRLMWYYDRNYYQMPNGEYHDIARDLRRKYA